VLLFVLQLYAAISSKSLSLFATMADSFMDLLSGVILMYAARASTKSNWFKYPSVRSFVPHIIVRALEGSTTTALTKNPCPSCPLSLFFQGKSRMETAGTIVFASLMATVSLQLIVSPRWISMDRAKRGYKLETLDINIALCC